MVGIIEAQCGSVVATIMRRLGIFVRVGSHRHSKAEHENDKSRPKYEPHSRSPHGRSVERDVHNAAIAEDRRIAPGHGGIVLTVLDRSHPRDSSIPAPYPTPPTLAEPLSARIGGPVNRRFPAGLPGALEAPRAQRTPKSLSEGPVLLRDLGLWGFRPQVVSD